MNIRNKFKRGLAAVLSLSVAASAVFVFHFPLLEANAAGEHTHSVCGDSGCTDHGDVEWAEWKETNSLPGENDTSDEEDNRYFYLSDDVTIEEPWTPAKDTYLCLNGHSIKMNYDDPVVSVNDSFTLCDCKGGGVVTHIGNHRGRGVYVGNFGEFTMYGGNITGNTENDNGAGVYNGNKFTMYGGEISGNTTNNDSNGGGVFNRGTFTMYGGTITNNEASVNCDGGGVYVRGGSDITLGGTASITGNGTGGNVYLPSNVVITIDEANPLRSGAKIGVTTASGSRFAEITNGNDDDRDYREFFESDNEKRSVRIKNDNAIVLAEKSETKHIHKMCGHTFDCGSDYRQVEWEEWTKSNALPEVSGYYYIANNNVLLNDTWVPAKDTHICMNDNWIKMQDDAPAISVENGSLSLCNGLNLGSKIIHGDGYTGSGVYVKSGCELAVYDITITGNSDCGVVVEDGGTLTVGSKANITGNTMEGKNVNVLLHDGAIINIDSEDPPKSTASIGVSTLSSSNSVVITDENGGNYSGNFISDDEETYSIKIGADNKLLLTKNNPDSSDESDNSDSSDPNSSDPNSSDPNSSDPNSSDPNSSDPNSSDPNSSDPNSSDPNSSGSGQDKKQHDAHDGITIEWSDNDRLPESAGSYFLTTDVEITDTWEIFNDITLCLNGYSIIMNGNAAAVSVTGSFTLFDCENGGFVCHGDGYRGVGVSVKDGGTFAMYGGEINGNDGNGVTLEKVGSIKVGGTAKITDGVSLPDGKVITINESKPLTGDAKIVVKTEKTLADGESVAITDKDVKDYRKYFESGNTEYTVTRVNGDVLYLTKSASEQPQKHTHDGSDWEETDSLPTTAGHYYLTKDVTVSTPWIPAKDTYLCLNGYSITMNGGNAIDVTKPNFTLCDCKGSDTASVYAHVSGSGSITVGGKLKADIHLATGKVIGVGNLAKGAKIGVTTEAKPIEGNNVAITGANSTNITSFFTSKNNKFTIVNGARNAVELSVKKSEPPPVVEPTKHIHPICGDINCKARHNAPDEWTAWTETTYLPTTQGYYYLEYDVTLSEAWTPADDTYLCLNGHDITLADRSIGSVVEIRENASLTLCDCAMYASGNKTADLAEATSVDQVEDIIKNFGTVGGGTSGIKNDGEFYMYGGVITGNTASGVRNRAEFVMNGGVIIDNSATNGGGVFNAGSGTASAHFTMYGGVITDNGAENGGGLYNNGIAWIDNGRIFKNTADEKGGGVFQDGDLTVNNGAYIMGNTVNRKKNNVYLPGKRLITVGTGLTGEVGVTLESNPATGGSVKFAEASSSVADKTLRRIKSDSGSFTTTITTSAGKKILKLVRVSDNDDDETDQSRRLECVSVSGTQIPQSDRTAITDLMKTMPDWVVGAYYDVTLYEDDEEVGESAVTLKVTLTVPPSIRASGRVFKVIRVYDGKATLLDDIDSDPNTVTVRSRLFSTYAIIYRVSGSGAVSGSGTSSGSNGSHPNPAMGVKNEIPLAGLACGFTALALAAPGKKIDK